LTHIVGEVHQGAASGTSELGKAVEAYRMASRFGKPLAATASGWDWAYVKENGCEDLVRLWIALTYAHGQRFMVPHPTRQWCFTTKLGTHWYEAPVEAYAPLYRFIRKNAACFDGFEDPGGAGVGGRAAVESPKGTLAVARRRADGAVVLHILNLDHDVSAKRLRPASSVSVTLPASLPGSKVSRARLLSYDAEAATLPLTAAGDKLRLEVPQLRIWILAVLE
jgi:hypothetical protein